MIVHFLLAALSLYWLWWVFMKKDPLASIPGPKGLPFIGNMLQIDANNRHISATELSRKYGDICKISLLGKQIVIVSGMDYIYEVLVKKGNDFAGRKKEFLINAFSFGYCDVATADPTVPWWHEMKKLTMSHLKGYGAGLKKLEAITLQNVRDAIAILKVKHGRCINIKAYLEDVIVNITYMVTLGRNLKDKEERRSIVKFGKDLVALLSFSGLMLSMFPLLRYFGNQAWKNIHKLNRERWHLFRKWERQALQQKEDSNFINLLHKLKQEKFPNEMTQANIIAGTYLNFVGGTTTTLGTLSSLFHILADRPDIQDKLHEEVDAVTAGRDVMIDDRNYMPYHMATIYEILRYAPVVPILSLHKPLCDTSLGDHKIPKGTIIWCNIWALQHNENIYKDPYKFQPERFLDGNGQLVPADHPNRVHLLTFGAGPRVCAGETFAMTRMFLILAQMMKAFEFLPPDDGDQGLFDCRNMISGFALMAHDYKLWIKDRTQLVD